MTRWLASVKSLQEAQLLSAQLPDILDMKDPSKGALGALRPELVEEVVSWVHNRCLTSATIGDLPMDAELIAKAMTAMAATGVDYVKVGLFVEPNLEACVEALADTVKSLNKPVIAVIFADQAPQPCLVAQLKRAGFVGLMVDTAEKKGLSLLDHWSLPTLQRFVNAVQEQGMLCGLAGALKVEDIELLQPLGADYLGFRSALCDKRQRTAQLEPKLASVIQSTLRTAVSLAS